jgi:endonuclease/exonuclease/phosphatase family metal-dependent hydrolase
MRVMTRNVFIGADLKAAYEALVTADGLARLPAVVAEIFNPQAPLGIVQQTDFSVRAAALADEIASAQPDLVGLQEAALWRTRDPVVVYDHLATLEAELARRGLGYRRAGVLDTGDVELPSAAGITVGLTNRIAILAREGGAELSGMQTGTFASALPINTPLGAFPLTRGWASVNVALRGRTARFITTHLEVATGTTGAEVQLQQVAELVDGPARTPLPVVMVGDFNARPGRPTYAALRAAGFDDAWTRANPHGPPGFTCCHPLPLDDPTSAPGRRIDLVLTRGDIVATAAFVVGAGPADFTSGLWPSDHAGVVADLAFATE